MAVKFIFAAALMVLIAQQGLLPSVKADDFAFDDEDSVLAKDQSSGDGPLQESVRPPQVVFPIAPPEESGPPQVVHPIDPPQEPNPPQVVHPIDPPGEFNPPEVVFPIGPPQVDLPPVVPPRPPSVGHFRPNFSNPTDYIPVQTCGTNVYCRRGYRGPCHRNEIFTSAQSAHSLSISRYPTCPASSASWRKHGCHSSSSSATSVGAFGLCRLRYPHKPCYGYPRSYRYCKRTRRCYRCQSKGDSLHWSRRTLHGHCGRDQVFSAIDGVYGKCKCRKQKHVECKLDNRCHHIYTQGPCKKGQWIVPSGSHGICQQCPCPSLADGRHIYWSGNKQYRPGCYRSYSRGPCPPGMYFKIDNYMTGAARCVHTSLASNTYSSYGSQSQRPNLYSLLMDWPSYSQQSSAMNSPLNYYGYDHLPDDELFFGNGLLG